ncbi:hypothetical protein F5B19DRAFT_504719 [Rostrohypoxylon terebratum]|nr:hypothetical protein F5B19DRAFT_504719 [Rostrohypoxylon terebratum]
MDSQRRPSDAQVSESCIIPVGESQQDQAMASPASDDSSSELSTSVDNEAGGDEDSVSTVSNPQAIDTPGGSSDLQAMGDSTINQDVEMKNGASDHQTSRASPAPILILTSQSPNHASGQDNEMDVDSSTSSEKESTGGHPTTPRREEAESPKPPVLTLSLRPRPSAQPTTQTATMKVSATIDCLRLMGEGDVTTVSTKRRRDPDYDDLADQIDASMPSDAQRVFAFEEMASRLMRAWEEVLRKCGMVLGSREAMNIVFEPDIDAIRNEALGCWPLDRVADVVEAEMLEQWRVQCRRVIERYSAEMYHRCLVREARDRVAGIRESVLAEAARVRDPLEGPATPHTPRPLRIPNSPGARPGLFDLGLPSTPRERPTQPEPSTREPTPLDKKRRVREDVVDALSSQISDMDINPRKKKSRTGGGKGSDTPHTPSSERCRKGNGRGVMLPSGLQSLPNPGVPRSLPRTSSIPCRSSFGRSSRRGSATPTRPWVRGRRAMRTVLDGNEGDDEEGEDERVRPYPMMGALAEGAGVAAAGNEEPGNGGTDNADVDVLADADEGKKDKKDKDEGDDDVFS